MRKDERLVAEGIYRRLRLAVRLLHPYGSTGDCALPIDTPRDSPRARKLLLQATSDLKELLNGNTKARHRIAEERPTEEDGVGPLYDDGPDLDGS